VQKYSESIIKKHSMSLMKYPKPTPKSKSSNIKSTNHFCLGI